MLSLIEHSLIYRLFALIRRYYRTSILRRILSRLGLWCRSSRLYSFMVRFAHRESVAGRSISFRVIKHVAKVFDSLVGKIHDFFKVQFASSRTIAYFNLLKGKEIPAAALILVFTSAFAAGFLFVMLIKGSFSLAALLRLLAIMEGIVLAAFAAFNWNRWIRNSLVYRIYEYILK